MALLIAAAACGSEEVDSATRASDVIVTAASEVPTTTVVDEVPEQPVVSEIVDGVLVVDFSTVENTRSMTSTVFGDDGVRAGMFVTANDDGAIGRYSSFESEGEEVMVPLGELSGPTDSFDLAGLPAGSYTLCVNLVGEELRACTSFTTP